MPEVTSTLTITIEMRDEGAPMVSTSGNIGGDWERRSVRYLGALREALHSLDCATDSVDAEPTRLWWVHS